MGGNISSFVTEQISRLSGKSKWEADNALHTLMEMGLTVKDDLIRAFKDERRTAVKVDILHILWQSRDPSISPFLLEAMASSEPTLWKQALDGLASISNGREYLLQALELANSRHEQDKIQFIVEAISDFEGP
jgi:hypothetical protein